MSGKLQPVHVRAADAATGKPTPCRLRITDAEGTYYAPYGRLTRFAAGANQDVGGNVYLGVKAHAYIDGSCEIALPPGQLHVEISKGPEYEPVRADVTLAPGKLALRFELRRWTDLRAEGWYAGDTRALFLTPHAALLEGQAEDLAVVNLLAAETEEFDSDAGEWRNAHSNLLAFSGQDFALEAAGCGVAVGTLNQCPELGTLALLNCHRVVYPLTFGGPHGTLNWTLADWCDQCHRKRGLVVWTEAAQFNHDTGHGEALADLILGKIDALELNRGPGWYEEEPAYWMRLLSAGIRVAFVGASGKCSNRDVLGSLRTYARLEPGQPFSYANWIEAVRAGRTFVTTGPLLELEVDGTGPSIVPHPVHDGRELQVRAEARSWSPFARLALCWNGAWVASADATAGPPHHAALAVARGAAPGGWLMACCLGNAGEILAYSAPVYIEGPPSPGWPDPRAIDHLVGALDAWRQWVEEKAPCASQRDRARLAEVFDRARRVLSERAGGGS